MTKHDTTTRPTHHVYVVEGEGDGRKAFWTRIGAAWLHGDGQGFNITLTAMPLNGHMVVRTAAAKPRQGTAQ